MEDTVVWLDKDAEANVLELDVEFDVEVGVVFPGSTVGKGAVDPVGVRVELVLCVVVVTTVVSAVLELVIVTLGWVVLFVVTVPVDEIVVPRELLIVE